MRAAIVVACVLSASTASAQGIGREWLEKMSGPKLDGWEERVPVWCNWKNEGPAWVWDSPALARRVYSERDTNLVCFDIGRATFANSDRDEAGLLVSAQRWESAIIFKLRSEKRPWLAMLEPSLAPGAIGFLTDRGQQWRFTLAVRGTLKPLNVFKQLRENGWGNVVQIAGRGQWMPSITNTDLNLGPGYEAFDDRWLWGGSWLVIDLSEKLGLR